MKKAFPVFLSALTAASMLAQTALAAPHEIYSRIEMNTADYYLDSAVDEFGNAVIFPKKTTFAENPDAVSGATTLTKRFTVNANAGTNAVYAYAADRAETYRDWASQITRITALSYDWSDIVRGVPTDLQFEEQADGLMLKTKNLTAGVYTVRIYSSGAGGDTFVFNLNIQNPAPVLHAPSKTATVQKGTSFRVTGVDFSWKSPVAEVLLNGKPLNSEQYALYPTGELLTLSEGVLTQAGENTLQLKLYGYHDTQVLKFDVQAAEKQDALGLLGGLADLAFAAPAKIDALASATTGGSGSGDPDAVSGATGTVPAFLTFNFDLLSNALILEEQGMGTEETARVLKWWNDASPEVVRGKDSMDLYGWEAYVTSGKAFEEHVKTSPKASAADGLFWDMWEVKNVLENGQLGDPHDFYEQIAAAAPVITDISADWAQGVTLTFGDASPEEFAAWAAQIPVVESSQMHENTAAIRVDSTGLYKSQYTVDTASQQLTLPRQTLADTVSEGSTLTVRSSGYKTISQKITFQAGSYTPQAGAETYYAGDAAEITALPADIKMSHVKVQGSSDTLSQGSNSGKSKYFTVTADGQGKKLVLSKATFTEPGTYLVKLFSENYAPQTVKIKVIDATGRSIYQIDAISDVALDALTAGYEAAAATGKSVTVKNTGNQPLTNLSATLSEGAEDWVVLGALEQDLAAGTSASLRISPKLGLAAGQYTATVTIKGDNAQSVSFEVTQTVTAADDNTPGTERPTLPAGSYYIDEDVVITGFSGLGTGVLVNGKELDASLYLSESNGTLTIKKGAFAKADTYEINLYTIMPTLGSKKSITIVNAPDSAPNPGDDDDNTPGAERPVLPAGSYYIDEDAVITGFSGTGTGVQINGKDISSSLYISESTGTLTLKAGTFTKAGKYEVNVYVAMPFMGKIQTITVVDAPN